MFLTADDYKTVCSPRELDVLQQSDIDTRKRAENTALEEVAGYLRTRYDMNKAFAAEGDERNQHLVQICVNIVLFYLVQWLPQKMASGNRTTLYEYAIDWLKSAQSGKTVPNLPTYSDDSGTDTGSGLPIITGGMPKQKNDW